MRKITFIPGDGIGPEVSLAAKRCIDATGVKIEWETAEAGSDVIDKYGTPLPEAVIESIKRNKIAIKGPIITPIGKGFRSVNVALRKKLNLYTCLRPTKSYEGVPSRYKNVDIVIFRENTEDLYAGIEFQEGTDGQRAIIETVKKISGEEIRSDSGISIKPISRFATRRIFEVAFQYAIKNGRKKVTCVHKANIIKYSDGLFLDEARKVAQKYEGKIEFEDRIVDNMCMQLVLHPENFDCLVLPNLYGDILSDLCAGLVGGLGVAPGANIGDEYAVFEATHGSAPKYTGLNKVNPCAMILSGVLMLRHIGEVDAADRLEKAVAEVLREGKFVTYDLKEDRNDKTAVGTSQMADAIIEKLR
ncbi:MAG: isocitrate/isopropylmalate dehydrogenase family protein [Candidatus Omnitrophota bacterium]